MAFRQVNADGSISTGLMHAGPRTFAGMGCGPSGCAGYNPPYPDSVSSARGTGRLPPRAGALNRASAVQLASGAFGGPRAAKYALEAFMAQNPGLALGPTRPPVSRPSAGVTRPAGLGSDVSDAADAAGGDGSSDVTVWGGNPALDRLLAQQAMQQQVASEGGVVTGAPSTTTSDGGVTSQDVAKNVAMWAPLAATLAGTGLNVYGQVTGRQPVQQRPVYQQQSAGLSTGAMVGIGLGALTLVAIVAISMRGGSRRAPASAGTPTVIRANGRRYVVKRGRVVSNRPARKSRYARKAA